MDLVEVCENEASLGLDHFRGAMDVWMHKPQVVSRRLCGSVIYDVCLFDGGDHTEPRLSFLELNSVGTDTRWRVNLDLNDWNGTDLDKTEEGAAKVYPGEVLHFWEEFILRALVHFRDNCLPKVGGLQSSPKDGFVHLLLRKLLPRQLPKMKAMMELIIQSEFCESDRNYLVYMFLPLPTSLSINCINRNQFLGSYGFLFTGDIDNTRASLLVDRASLNSESDLSGTLMASPQWLQNKLWPKVKTWALEESSSSSKTASTGPCSQGSLQLVNIEDYNILYNELKAKYADYLVEIWPENTDPKKFVYEDIGIAAYLILTWRRLDPGKKVTFVDIGCGNGLLVYLLSQEGYSGIGLDLRRRKIWDTFGEKADLQETSLFPNEVVFPFDWVIGNHSDELTPWIPIIAARSSSNYFNLPCCFHTFEGKFQRGKPNGTQYEQYLSFVKDIGERCHYKVETDKLRIPSTKKICQLGIKAAEITHMSQEDKEIHLNQILTSFGCKVKLGEATLQGLHGTRQKSLKGANKEEDGNCISPAFVPRDACIPVRNCSRVDSNLRDSIVHTVYKAVLTALPKEPLSAAYPTLTSKGFQCSEWDAGGSVAIEDVVLMFDKGCLAQLKSQCGGLKTLLKNYGHIFKVVKGLVSLRCYAQDNKLTVKSGQKRKRSSRKEEYRKTRRCWFDLHHPQGCILTADKCDFLHEGEERSK